MSSEKLGVDEHAVVKTLVMEDEEQEAARRPDARRPRRLDEEPRACRSARSASSRASPRSRERHSGYQVGGTSPFGLRKPMPIYVREDDPRAAERIYINGGRRGFLVGIDPKELVRVVAAKPVDVALSK